MTGEQDPQSLSATEEAQEVTASHAAVTHSGDLAVAEETGVSTRVAGMLRNGVHFVTERLLAGGGGYYDLAARYGKDDGSVTLKSHH